MNKENIKHFFRIAGVALIIFFFVPSFFVSCSGETMDMSAFRVFEGFEMEDYGTISEVQPIILLLLAIPIAIVVVWSLKEMEDRKRQLYSMILGIADFIGWIMLKNAVNDVANDYMCTFGTRWGYGANLIVIMAVIAGGGLLYFNVIKIDDAGGIKMENIGMWVCPNCAKHIPLTSKFCSNCGTQRVLSPAEPTCTSCGARLKPGAKFCEKCGNKVPDEQPQTLVSETSAFEPVENERVESVPEKKVCKNCGTELKEGAKFCASCGAAVESE